MAALLLALLVLTSGIALVAVPEPVTAAVPVGHFNLTCHIVVGQAAGSPPEVSVSLRSCLVFF